MGADGAVSISDVHVKEPGDVPSRLLLRFLGHPRTRRARTVVLLGDVFDLMVGSYPEYLERFRDVFGAIDAAAGEKEVHYFQGNHDFHLEGLFSGPGPFGNLRRVRVHRTGRVLTAGGRRAYFEHGDDAEIGNPGYKLYKRVAGSRAAGFLLGRALGHRVVHGAGSFLSGLSARRRERERERARAGEGPGGDGGGGDGGGGARDLFRRSAALRHGALDCDAVVLGHSHVRDVWDPPGGPLYLNNGYVPDERCFCFLEGGAGGLEPLGGGGPD